MKIAVTGATGFLGRYVVAELDRLGVAATLLVRPSTDIAGWAPRHHVVRFDLLQHDDGVFEHAGRPDVLIHLAWGGLPNYRSSHHLEQELPAHERFIRSMVAAGLAHVVVTGTCLEYGMQSGALAEDSEARPANPYASAKDLLRQRLMRLQAQTPFTLTWARLFYIYGEGQAQNSLWPSLQRAATRGDARFPMSGGEQLRDHLPVAEAARMLVALALSARDHGIVNVCTGRPVSVRSLVEGWIRDNGWSIEPELGRFPYPDHEPMAFWGDDRKLRRCLNAQ
jgi:nucleoside-diphosphate-sugar epimerase